MMSMLCIRFYVQEDMKHGHLTLHDWLFETARESGIPGGTVFRATAGFGRHGLHEDHFFELAGKLPETVEFFAEADKIAALIERVGKEGLRLVYVTHPVSAGVTGA
jgi:PII-like signaling protein